MANSISLTLEAPSFSQNVPTQHLPPFGYQRRSSSQTNRNRKSSNTLPNKFKHSARNGSTLRRQADVVRYATSKKSEENLYEQMELQQRVYFHNVFSPDIHSTPVHKNTNLIKETSCNSLNSGNNNVHTDIPPPVPNFYINDYELFKSAKNNDPSTEQQPNRSFTIPTVSGRVDRSQSNISTGTDRVESAVVKKRGMCGVSWILRLGFRDSTVNKVYRRQAGWTVLVLIIIVLIGSALLPFSSHFSSYHFIQFTNITQTSPKIVADENITIPTTGLPPITSTTTETSTTQEPMYSEDANIVIMVTEDLPTVVLLDTKTLDKSSVSHKKSNLKTDSVVKWEDSTVNNDNLTNELMGFCRGCRKDLDICIATPDSGVPICRTARDLNDPTGCGGLCALEIEACHLLNQQFSIYTCRPIQNLQPCEQDEWRCANLLCIPQNKRCDGWMNCYDKSDELDCMCNLTGNFQCGNRTSCLDLSKKCDGAVDCWDGSDELNCTQACPDDQFTCNSGECIDRHLFCDGLADCGDKTDEPSGCDGGCRKHEYKCTNKRCIAKTKVCNGIDNCGDMSDEMNCPIVKSS